jgi:hypothetical protein
MRGIGLAGLGIYQIVIRMALLSLMDIRVVNAVEKGSEGETHGINMQVAREKKRKRKKKGKITARKPHVSSKAKCFKGLGGYIDLYLEWYLRGTWPTAIFCFVPRYPQVLDPLCLRSKFAGIWLQDELYVYYYFFYSLQGYISRVCILFLQRYCDMTYNCCR